MQDRAGELAGDVADLDLADGPSMSSRYVSKASRSTGGSPSGDPECPTDRDRLVVVARPVVARQRLQPRVVRGDRRVDERRVDPQRQVRVEGAVVARAPTTIAAVELRQAADLGPRPPGRPVHDPEVRAQGAREGAHGSAPEVRVLGDARRDEGMGDLQEQRPRPGAEQEHRLAVQPPGLRSGPEHPDRLGLRIHAGTITPRSREGR